MTPEERNLVIELFDRLATLEDAQRDPEAERLIRDGLRQAPNAPYALVQTVLVQDEALKRADARIHELEGAVATDTEPRDASFLGGMRDSLFGKREGRGSVPSVRSTEPASTSAPVSPAWHTGTQAPMPAATQAPMPAATQAPMPVAPAGAPGAPGGSFLGTAAAAAAGVIGGSLLMSSIRSLMGHPQGAHAAFDPASGASGSSPWSGSDELAREAGLGDIGRTPSSGDDTASRGYGALDDRGNDDEPDDQGADDLDDDGLGFDDNGGDSEE
jgi:hypothetical protein